MKGRGNPPLPFYLLLVIYGAGAAWGDTSTVTITSVLEYTSSAGNNSLVNLGTTATTVLATESTPLYENSNVSAAINQSTLNGSVTATASPTTSNSNYTNTEQTLVLSTTVSNKNYSELTVPTKPTQHAPEISDRPATTSNLRSNLSSSTQQPETATQHSSDISAQANTTALNNSNTSKTKSVEQTTPMMSHQPNTSSLSTIHPSSTASTYTNLSSRTEPIPQHTSDTSRPLTTALLINNQTSSTEQPAQYSSDRSAHPATTHGPTTPYSSMSPANMTSSASENNTKHISSTTNTTSTVATPILSVNATSFHVQTTHLPDGTTNSSTYTTGVDVIPTKHPNMSSTVETIATHSGSTVTNSHQTETPVTPTNATFTIQSYTSNSSTSVANNTSPAEHSTKSPNETTRGMSTFTTKIVQSGTSISPSTQDHTATSGFPRTSIADSNPCRNVLCPSISVCVPKSPSYICVTGKIFPGKLTLNDRTFLPEMANVQSNAFIEPALQIENILNKILENKNGYIGSTVRKLMSGSIIADIENIFQQSSNVTSDEIANEVDRFIRSCTDCGPLTNKDSYKEQNLCSLNKCDNMTTSCDSGNGVFACKCKEGFYKSFNSEQSCAACPSGYKFDGNLCVKCPFGYAGFNCDDSSLLAVVVISCVLGSLLLILLTSLFIACHRSKKLRRESHEHEAYLMWPKQEFPKIPRVTMNHDSSQMDYGSKNILVDNEISNGNTVSPEASRMEGDLKTFSNKNPSRYSYLNHGQTNPYFVNEEN